MNNILETMKDLETFTNELKTFDWNFKNGSIDANRYGFDMIRNFQFAATFSPAHQKVWAEYEKEHLDLGYLWSAK